jgi:hypothetical protein
MARASNRVRSGLIGLLFVLACLGITVSTVAVWAHQTLLVTDRFVAVTSRVVAEPDVQARAAQRLASQIVTAADVQGRVAGVLPENQKFLAIPLANAVEGVLDKRLTTFFATEKAQAAFQTAIRFTHAHLVTLLRNDSDFVSVEGTTATIDLLPIAVEGLRALQEEGILPASITLPDVTDPAGRDAAIASIESKLGRDLPDDFALIPIANAKTLAAAQGAVRAFDIAVVVLLLVTLALIVATVWLSGRRLRMVILLSLGIVVSLLLARLIVRAAVNGLVTSLATGDGVAAIREAITDLTADLGTWTWLLVILGIIVALAAFALSRPEWLTSGVAAVSAPTSRGDRVEAWFRDHAQGIGWTVGILLTVLLMWIALSPELAILVGIGLVVVAVSVGRRGTGTTDASGATAG